MKYELTCHCQSVRLSLWLPNGLIDPRRCSCSICRRKGAVVSSVPLPDLKVVRGADALTLYQFNTYTAKHYFCSVCGIYTHHQRRSNPREFAFNIACVEDFAEIDLAGIPTYDGINHPSDS